MDRLTRIMVVSVFVIGIAVLNATSATSFPPATEVVEGAELSMTVDKTIVHTNETVNMNLTLKNIENDTITLVFPSAQVFDVYLCIHGRPVLPWSYDKFFAQVVWELTLDPGETYAETLQWDFARTPAEPGHYELMGVCVAYTCIWTDPLPTRAHRLWIVSESS